MVAVTVLPETDSPTIASTSPFLTSKADVLDGMHWTAVGGEVT